MYSSACIAVLSLRKKIESEIRDLEDVLCLIGYSPSFRFFLEIWREIFFVLLFMALRKTPHALSTYDKIDGSPGMYNEFHGREAPISERLCEQIPPMCHIFKKIITICYIVGYLAKPCASW